MGVEGVSVEMMNFNEMVSMLVEAMDTQAGKIEEEKLKVGRGGDRAGGGGAQPRGRRERGETTQGEGVVDAHQ